MNTLIKEKRYYLRINNKYIRATFIGYLDNDYTNFIAVYKKIFKNYPNCFHKVQVYHFHDLDNKNFSMLLVLNISPL